jgi:hypothetical protein
VCSEIAYLVSSCKQFIFNLIFIWIQRLLFPCALTLCGWFLYINFGLSERKNETSGYFAYLYIRSSYSQSVNRSAKTWLKYRTKGLGSRSSTFADASIKRSTSSFEIITSSLAIRTHHYLSSRAAAAKPIIVSKN